MQNLYTSLQVDMHIYMTTHLDLLLQEVDFVLLLQKLLLLSCNLWTEHVKLSDMSNCFSIREDIICADRGHMLVR